MSGYFLSKDGEKFELEGETLIGRSDECDLKISEGHPSRRHALLTVTGDGAWLEDLESANGTYVNEQRISAKTKLNSGDRISFDTAAFAFEAPAADEGDATVVRRVPPIDDGATVVRSIPPAPEPEAATPEPPAPEPEPASAPAPEPPKPEPVAAAAEPPPAPEPPPPEPEPVAAAPEPPPPPPAPEPKPEPTPEPAAAKASEAVPRSWADPEYQNEQGTRMFTPEELKAMTEGIGEASAAAASGIEGAHLQITKGANAGATLIFGDDKNEWTVGTDADRDLSVSDTGVSAFHAKITREGQRWKVIDQMSANGTFVNEQKGTVSFLSSGDKVRFGPVECTVVLPAGGKSKGARKARKAGTAKKSGSNTWIIAALAAVGTIALLVIALQFV